MAEEMVQPTQALPMSLEEITGLVKTLYDPGQAKKVSETEATLRILQRSAHGWDIADALLNNPDENVRFFGALTFTIKLNADSAGLSDEDSRQILSKLISHLVSRSESGASTRKLCSTLAQYFCKPISSWVHCIRSLALSFAHGQLILDDSIESYPSTWEVLPQLSDAQLLLLLDFAMVLADEAKRMSSSTDRTTNQRMIVNAKDVEPLLHDAFRRGLQYLSSGSLELGEKICFAALKCFVGWIFYAQSDFQDAPDNLRYLRSVTEMGLSCLEYHIDDAMELIAEVLENYSKFFEAKQQEQLWSAIVSPWGYEILSNSDAETVSLARIIVAYGQILLESKVLFTNPDDPHHVQVMSVLHELLNYPQVVGVEDEVAPVALEFWSNYVSTITEEVFQYTEETTKPDWMAKASMNVLQAVSEFLRKIIFPQEAITGEWDSESKKTFKVFRVDVRDIFQEAYEVLREGMLDQFVDFTLRALESSNWLELEGGLFCLKSISELVTEAPHDRLARLFEQPLFSIISGANDIPLFTQRATVDLVAAYNNFFLREPKFLPQVLPFLLNALQQPSLAHSAAKSFASLCSECRKSLVSELASFFQMYQQFLGYQTAEEYTKSKVLEGIAAIVSAQDTDEKRHAGLQEVFKFIVADAMQSVNAAKVESDPEKGQVLALTTLKCLAGVGKAMSGSDEDIIDLVTERTPSQYWTAGPGKEIQNQIINFVNYLTQIYPDNSDLIETACNILRIGIKETLPGPFVIPASAHIDWIVKTNIQTPRVPYILETACCWISSNKSGKTEDYQAQAQRLMHYILTIMQALQHPRTDPEIALGCIEVIQKFINTDAQILTSQQPDVLKGMFDFSVECIKSPEVLPKRASAQLWKDIFELTSKTTSDDQSTGQEIVNHFGQAVSNALIDNVCGEVDPSSLEHIIIPLRKLLLSDRNAKTYITNALGQNALLLRVKDDPNVGEIVRKFIEGLTRNARNSTAFKETVKEFYQRCKVMHMQFAPPMHPGHRYAQSIVARNTI
ncbi:ARM repeat-containing protein [Polyplosphaeria fusca]|uniref:ARM repeat-containing protein n=1 Tax=Polyplosphaeria fusca TaxID=682080 RepID=A0A9P4QUI4_9PLEO|nr:ARM repeat-containing protein [Polyplosphaeria fusca]